MASFLRNTAGEIKLLKWGWSTTLTNNFLLFAHLNTLLFASSSEVAAITTTASFKSLERTFLILQEDLQRYLLQKIT